MKVLCISDGLTSLTKGEWYGIISYSESSNGSVWGVRIKDDRGIEMWYYKSNFKTQGEVRDEKFKELGI